MSIDGKTRQGRISIEALRAITGRIDETMAIFVEDAFAKEWVEGITRSLLPEHMDEIGVYGVAGESQAHAIHTAHTNNPALRGKLKSICILDGNAPKAEQQDLGVLKLPGEDPEAEVFNYVLTNIDTLAMKLAVVLHLPPARTAMCARL